MNDLQKIKKVRLALNSLSIYRELLQDKVVKNLLVLLDFLCIEEKKVKSEEYIKLYCNLYYELASSDSSICLKNYIIEKLIFSENPFSIQAGLKDYSMLDENLKKAAEFDLIKLEIIAKLSSNNILDYMLDQEHHRDFEIEAIKNLPLWNMSCENSDSSFSTNEYFTSIKKKLSSSLNWNKYLKDICDYHNKYGSGIFAMYKAFSWESGILEGVCSSDPITIADLVGYEDERQIVIDNTLQFLKGYPANNILLYGDRGTGKSSTIKAILNEYYEKGLRIIEITKNNLINFSQVIRTLEKTKLKFIIFVDDLSFEDNEENYAALKAVLEGSLGAKPKNAIIYATSNRRHLVKEKFSERSGMHSGIKSDEIRANDSLQEKLSLSDRFGITVVFSSPDKKSYLDIVEGIAENRGLKIDREYLHREALKWEMWYNGRSPRTARQFIDWLEGHLAEDIF